MLAKTRKITSILQRSVDSLKGDLPYNNMAAQLADIIDRNAAIVNGGGVLSLVLRNYEAQKPILIVGRVLELNNFQRNTHVVLAVFMILTKKYRYGQ